MKKTQRNRRKKGRKNGKKNHVPGKNLENEKRREELLRLLSTPQKVVYVQEKNRSNKIESDDTKKRDDSKNKRTLRAPVVVVLGNVDSGKTLLLDGIRKSNTQSREAGGITQQIGTTFVSIEKIRRNADQILKKQRKKLKLQLPGLCFIDTPGHHSFENLRRRGSCVADIAILVIDILKGVQPQTIESIRRLRSLNIPFVVALNKIDRLNCFQNSSSLGDEVSYIADILKSQEKHTLTHYESLLCDLNYKLQTHGLNSREYFRMSNFGEYDEYVSIVPISAKTGDGIADLLLLLTQLSQTFMKKKLKKNNKKKKKKSHQVDFDDDDDDDFDGEGSILEKMFVEGIGPTIDVLITSGEVMQGDLVMVVSKNSSYSSNLTKSARIRSILTPKGKNKELRCGDGGSSSSSSHGGYIHHKKAECGICVRLAGPGIGSNFLVVGSKVFFIRKSRKEHVLEKMESRRRRRNDDDEEEEEEEEETKEGRCVKKEKKDDMMLSIRKKQNEHLVKYSSSVEELSTKKDHQKKKIGVTCLCNSIGTLEALKLTLEQSNIPVKYSRVTHKASPKDLKICGMTSKEEEDGNRQEDNHNDFKILILYFTKMMNRELIIEAKKMGVKVIYGEILYKILDEVHKYLQEQKKKKRITKGDEICWPVKLRILPEHIYRLRNPFIFGVEVVSGQLRVGTRLCVVKTSPVGSKDKKQCRCFIILGKCVKIMNSKRQEIQMAKEGESVSVEIKEEGRRGTKYEGVECYCDNEFCSWGAGYTSRNSSYGRHFDHRDVLVSRINRRSIDIMKELFPEELKKNNKSLLRLIVELKILLGI